MSTSPLLHASQVKGLLADAEKALQLVHAADQVLPIISAVAPQAAPLATLVKVVDTVAPEILAAIKKALADAGLDK